MFACECGWEIMKDCVIINEIQVSMDMIDLLKQSTYKLPGFLAELSGCGCGRRALENTCGVLVYLETTERTLTLSRSCF